MTRWRKPSSELREMFARTQEEQPDQGPARITPTAPPGLGRRPGVHPVALPAVNFAPPGAIPIDRTGDADISFSAVVTLLTINVPLNTQFHVDGIGLGADSTAALADLAWSVLIGGVPAYEYTNLAAAVGSIRRLATIILHGAGPTTLAVRAQNTSQFFTHHYICRVRGWLFVEFYP
jgi:hypothetical protein